MSRPNAQVKWYKNRKELLPNKKYHLISQDVYRQLIINDVCSSDEDTYTCDAGDDNTSCQLLVEGEMIYCMACIHVYCSNLYQIKTQKRHNMVVNMLLYNQKCLFKCPTLTE